MKLGIVGSGMIVNDFLTMVKDIPEIELKAITGTQRSYEKLLNLQKEHEITSVYTDIEECLKEAEVDTIYVALPNHLHYEYTKKALEYNKNVICEKPFTLSLEQFMELKALALSKKLVLVEAITNQYLGNYQTIKNTLPKLGDIKLIECNYSQYSSRYDAFKEGTILPAFDPKKGGGALMDINIYNIHFVVGLLGKPKEVRYLPNIEKNIDTSGILMMDYDTTKVVCIGAKDSTAEIRSTIQGNLGSVIVNGATNEINQIEKQMLKQEKEIINHNIHTHRMYEEFKIFNKMIETQDMKRTKEQLEHSQIVMEIVDKSLKSAGIILG
ncbi:MULTISPECIES: Gfo/Idh/MocA family oxidoreductase [Vagococcus]|uniref:NAD-dependent oxidoreductase n=1 Tax=Vagococcus fluvialis bH819 TaxID=1255619 RepID=A0A1X6WKQ6_9ENTE|nr:MULTISPECIES: Gfo/Idh/MocA family oxidoreductase [Vagococcus]SLM84822.1 NAD-dependent oxidoreductase [Vagococcus fluvialis bH819]HCM89729.1 gfo/Idh/MocA family oxidoreductase [Vagococcus sp.]